MAKEQLCVMISATPRVGARWPRVADTIELNAIALTPAGVPLGTEFEANGAIGEDTIWEYDKWLEGLHARLTTVAYGALAWKWAWHAGLLESVCKRCLLPARNAVDVREYPWVPSKALKAEVDPYTYGLMRAREVLAWRAMQAPQAPQAPTQSLPSTPQPSLPY